MEQVQRGSRPAAQFPHYGIILWVISEKQGLAMKTRFDEHISDEQVDNWLGLARRFLQILTDRKKQQFNRRVSIGDLLTERAGNAAAYDFGEGTTMYDNVLVLGNVKVGKNTWIGPNCILDGSGYELRIGDWCDISAG